MIRDILGGIEITDIFLDNKFQKILLCKDKKSKDKYLLNTIYNKKPVEAVDMGKLIGHIPILTMQEDDESLQILTKYDISQSLTGYFSNKQISLSNQVKYMTDILEQLIKFKHLPIHIIYSLFDHNRMSINDEGRVELSGPITIEENYLDLSIRDVLLKLSNIFELIFTGTSITTGALSNDIPPDIRKIVEGCKQGEYIKFGQLISDFKDTKLYRLMNPETEEAHRVHKIRRTLNNRRIIHTISNKTVKIAILLVILIPVLIYAGSKLIGTNETYVVDEEESNFGDKKSNINDDNLESSDSEEFLEETVEDIKRDVEELYDYFNESLLNRAKNEKLASIDSSISYKGEYSLNINNSGGKNSYLVGIIDLDEASFRYLSSRSITFSTWLVADKQAEVTLTLKLYNNDGDIISQAVKKIETKPVIWTLHNIDISTVKGSYIKIYVTTSDDINLWVDGYSVDILK